MSSISESISKDALPVAVAVNNVTKVYPGGVEALNNMTIQFPKGELTSILGPSGCGKTTLLKIILPSASPVIYAGLRLGAAM